jgi:hypothetical protein
MYFGRRSHSIPPKLSAYPLSRLVSSSSLDAAVVVGATVAASEDSTGTVIAFCSTELRSCVSKLVAWLAASRA